MINRDYLQEIVRNKSRLSRELGIPRTTLWRKLKGTVEFTETEINKLQAIYGKEIFK